MAKSGTKSLVISKATKSRSSAPSLVRSATSSRPGAPAERSDDDIIIVSRDSPSRGKTDFEKLRNLTDEEIEASIKNDPDWSDDWNWGEAVLVIPPKKKAISIRVDEDVLDFFKHEGDGYQRRINAVLRSYMQQKQARKPKKRA